MKKKKFIVKWKKKINDLIKIYNNKQFLLNINYFMLFENFQPLYKSVFRNFSLTVGSFAFAYDHRR